MEEKANIKTKIAVVGIIVFTLLIIGIISFPNVIERTSLQVGEKEEQDATSAQVLSGKTFTSSAAGVGAAGAMADFTNNLQTATVASNATGVSTINVPAGYYEQIQVDASAVYNKGIEDAKSSFTHFGKSQTSSYSSSYQCSFPAYVGRIYIVAVGDAYGANAKGGKPQISVTGATVLYDQYQDNGIWYSSTAQNSVELLIIKATSTTVGIRSTLANGSTVQYPLVICQMEI